MLVSLASFSLFASLCAADPFFCFHVAILHLLWLLDRFFAVSYVKRNVSINGSECLSASALSIGRFLMLVCMEYFSFVIFICSFWRLFRMIRLVTVDATIFHNQSFCVFFDFFLHVLTLAVLERSIFTCSDPYLSFF